MPVTHKQIANTFRKAKAAMVKNGGWQSKYICDNIATELENNAASEAALNIISTRLEGQFSLEYWLEANGFPEAMSHTTYVLDKMRAYRFVWLDMLIAEYSRNPLKVYHMELSC